jgi:hypothetical protein
MEQIERKSAAAFAKETSSRFKQYVERTGSKECWEVEAIDPEFLQNQVHDAVLLCWTWSS